MCATPESFAAAAFGDAAAPGGSGADVLYRDAEPVVWVGWSTPPAVFQLTTVNGSVWVSNDGEHWRPL